MRSLSEGSGVVRLLTLSIVSFFFLTLSDTSLPRKAAGLAVRSTGDGSVPNAANTTAEMLAAAHARLGRKASKTSAGKPQPMTRPDDAGRFYLQQRLAAGQEELPMEHLRARLDEIEFREAARAAQRTGSNPGGIQGWQSIGPGNIGGRTRAIVFDPTNPNVVFAAGVAGGIFKSFDGGATWNPTADLMLNLAVCTLVIDPTNPNVLYAGTGEGFGNGIFVRGLGIFKSTDAGASWAQLPSTSVAQAGGAFYYVNKIVLSPNDPSRLYAGTKHGVFRSTDAGASWQVILANPWYNGTSPTTNGCSLGCLDLAIRSDRDPDVLFATFGSFDKDGLFRSDDGGDTWTETVTPFYQGRMVIAIAPSDNDRIYVGMADNGDLTQFGRLAELWRSNDGGLTFSSPLLPGDKFGPWLFSYVSIATGCLAGYPIYSQGWYDQTLAVDPTDRDVLFVGGINMHRSDDGGRTFGIAGYWFSYLSEPPDPDYIHPDQHTIVFHPGYNGVTNQTMWVGNDGGLFRTTNARAATSQEECPIGPNPGPGPDIVWEHLGGGYSVTQYYHGDAALETDMFVGGSQDNGSSRGLSTVTPNAWKMIAGGDGGYVAIDPTNSQNVYIEIQGFPTIRKSTDGGDTFALATNGITDTDGQFITPFAMDQSDPNVLWTGGSRPWRTMDAAQNWSVVGPNFAMPGGMSAIGIAPSDGNVVYLGFDNGFVARTTNGLAVSPTWTVSSNGLPLGNWVSSVAVDPQDTELAYATYSNLGIQHVFKTTDGGGSWTSIDGISAADIPDIPVHWIAVRPSDSLQLYAGTEFGVFATDDGGTTWDPANDGLAHTVVETLDFTDDDTLVAFTFGRGVFVSSLDAGSTGAPDVVAVAETLALSVAPVPFRGAGRIEASLPRAGHVRLTIHDLQGRLVAEIANGREPAGRLIQAWDGRNRSGARVASGTYFARLEAGGDVATKKIVLIR